jgi:hypothetical protein
MFERLGGLGWWLAIVVTSLGGCGDDDGDDDTGSGFDPDRTWASLSAGERADLCDYLSEQLGGYGYQADCPDRDAAAWAAPDQAACLDSVPDTCATPVSVIEECIEAVSKDLCDGKRIQTTHPACVRNLQCR